MQGGYLSKDQINLINQYLIKEFSPYFIILFGSGAQDQLRPDSDIDLAFLSEENFNSYQIFMAAQELAGYLRKDVDLIDLKKASTVFKAQIICKGKIIYDDDSYKRMTFQMVALKDYALLNEERQCILDVFKKSRSINDAK